ncbi:hypothetical protein K501DRAFT_275341 [Backusella circina FSU 941]|nr:hypothetical protein K501DRAFT_275341 [Backusella circina FSU 941]
MYDLFANYTHGSNGIRMVLLDGTYNRKRCVNPGLKFRDHKREMEKRLVDSGHLKVIPCHSTSGPQKNELWNIIKGLGIQPVFSTYNVARFYGHQLNFTPPYHLELQPVEKVWRIMKNPISFNPS